jgi:hypothetical protein
MKSAAPKVAFPTNFQVLSAVENSTNCSGNVKSIPKDPEIVDEKPSAFTFSAQSIFPAARESIHAFPA